MPSAFCGGSSSLTPKHEEPYLKIMEAIETIFDIHQGYGFNWAFFLTFRNVPAETESIECMDVPDEEKDKIFFGNAAELLTLPH